MKKLILVFMVLGLVGCKESDTDTARSITDAPDIESEIELIEKSINEKSIRYAFRLPHDTEYTFDVVDIGEGTPYNCETLDGKPHIVLSTWIFYAEPNDPRPGAIERRKEMLLLSAIAHCVNGIEPTSDTVNFRARDIGGAPKMVSFTRAHEVGGFINAFSLDLDAVDRLERHYYITASNPNGSSLE